MARADYPHWQVRRVLSCIAYCEAINPIRMADELAIDEDEMSDLLRQAVMHCGVFPMLIDEDMLH